MRALEFAQQRLSVGGWRAMRRPILLTILMWFCGIYAVGAVVGISAIAAGFGEPSMGGMEVSREHWLAVGGSVIAVVALLMAVTAIGLRLHRVWPRWTWMAIWPFIVLAAVAFALADIIPWWLARQAFIDAAVVGALSAWALFLHQPSVLYFYRIRQTRSGPRYH